LDATNFAVSPLREIALRFKFAVLNESADAPCDRIEIFSIVSAI